MNSRFLLLSFDIYTMIFIKHLLSQYFILHQKLKGYIIDNTQCVQLWPQKNEDRGNNIDQHL
jgi:hypothetical protein